MTVQKINKLFEENNIPDDARLMSDSGWECSASDMDGVYYNRAKNIIVFTQGTESSYIDDFHPELEWELLYRVD